MDRSQVNLKLNRFTDILFKTLFRICAVLSASMVVFILLFIIKRGISVFLPSYPSQVSLLKFLTGFSWHDNYGVLFIVINTLLTSLLAMLIVVPIGVLAALYIAKIAPKTIANLLTTVIELLAAVPSVVYGVFASGVIVKWVDLLASQFHISTFGGRSWLSVSLLLAMMVLPTITSLSIVAIKAVKKDLENASLALGATKMQTYFKVVLPSAKSGIISSVVLGLARAFGEATAVSMVAGNKTIGPTLNPFDITRTLTSTMLSGLSETTGVDYDIRYSVGIVLIITIIISNLSLQMLNKRMSGAKS